MDKLDGIGNNCGQRDTMSLRFCSTPPVKIHGRQAMAIGKGININNWVNTNGLKQRVAKLNSVGNNCDVNTSSRDQIMAKERQWH